MTEAVIRPVGQAPGVSPGGQSVVSPPATLRALVLYFLGLGTWGFGGPVVLVERMRRDLQEARGWFTVAELKEAIAIYLPLENVGGHPALRILEPNASPPR